MQSVNNYNEIKLFLSILLITTLLVSLKWFFSYYLFDEDITLRIINETSDNLYYPIIKSYSDLNFAPSYSDSLKNLKIISFPILSLFINSLSFYIFGSYSFILLEFICTFLFLVIFYHIFLILNFSKSSSIIFSTFLYILPTILKDLLIFNIEVFNLLSLNFENFYTNRYPRPIISNLFFFSFIFLILKFYNEKKNFLKYLFLLVLLLGVTINTFFYHFIIEFLLLFIIFTLKFKTNFFKVIINNYKNFIIYFFILLFFILFFQIQILISEKDYIERLGLITINNSKKEIIYDYLISFFFNTNFLILFALNTLFFYLNKNKSVRVFYFLFISSVLSTIFFCLISNKGIDYNNFFSWIVISGSLFPVISLAHFFQFKISIILNQNYLKKLMLLLIICMITYFNASNSIKFKKNNETENSTRNSLNQVVTFIDNNDVFSNKNLEIFNYNYELSVWFILKDYKNFSFLPVSFWTPKKNATLEKELISSIKFLQLNKNSFYELIKNNFSKWRFNNLFVYHYFGRKYYANSLANFNDDLSDYETIEKKYIKSNSLIIAHQIIIPKIELKRLLDKFDVINSKINPDIVVLDRNSYFKISKLKDTGFCKIFDNYDFKIYINNNLKYECKLIKN
jgi:hypothetical protein